MLHRMARSVGWLAVLNLVVHAPSSTAETRVLVEHRGGDDPAVEGWTGTRGEAVFDDGGPGLDAWVADDDSTTNASGAAYQHLVTPEDTDEASTSGWKLSVRLRVVDVPDEPGGSPVAAYSDGTTQYAMHFGTTETGDPIVRLPTSIASPSEGPTVRLRGAGPGYHLYQLVFDPIEGNAHLFVDGQGAIIDYTGFLDDGRRIFWGSGSEPDVGHANYNFVRFEILDEPVTVGSQININLAGTGTNPMLAAETAGAPEVRDDNWNNLSGDSASGGAITLFDGEGAIVPDAMASYVGDGRSSLQDGGGVDDSHFFSSLIDAQNYPAFDIRVTDVPYDVYNVYAYQQGGSSTGMFRIARFSLGDLTFYAKRPVAVSDYVRSDATIDERGSTPEGSYVVFEGVSGPDFTLTIGGSSASDGFRRARVSGLQIVRMPETLEADADGDQILDADDNCPVAPNPDQRDANDNGRGDPCECGDFNGDGLVNTTDARLIQRCAVGQLACTPLADVTCDGRVNTTDARVIQRFSVGEFDETVLRCEELDACL